ncbi:hypothetical protein MFRU_004g03410 [Monilinia fructicola]|nr:hypothetical protein MFRU_004g03410 [Monilinia fructicola]
MIPRGNLSTPKHVECDKEPNSHSPESFDEGSICSARAKKSDHQIAEGKFMEEKKTPGKCGTF